MNTNQHTVRVSCNCDICKVNAEKVGAAFPLVALIREQAAAGLGVTTRNANSARKVHGFVWSAYDPSQANMATERRFSIPA